MTSELPILPPALMRSLRSFSRPEAVAMVPPAGRAGDDGFDLDAKCANRFDTACAFICGMGFTVNATHGLNVIVGCATVEVATDERVVVGGGASPIAHPCAFFFGGAAPIEEWPLLHSVDGSTAGLRHGLPSILLMN